MPVRPAQWSLGSRNSMASLLGSREGAVGSRHGMLAWHGMPPTSSCAAAVGSIPSLMRSMRRRLRMLPEAPMLPCSIYLSTYLPTYLYLSRPIRPKRLSKQCLHKAEAAEARNPEQS